MGLRLLKGMILIALAGTVSASAGQSDYHGPQRGQKDQRDQKGADGKGWNERSRDERLESLSKMLTWRLKATDTCPESAFLQTRASELLDRARQARANFFQFDSLASATYSLLRACERISTASQDGKPRDADRRDAALQLQRCYFRVQQAEYFAGLSGEKESKQYVTYSRSLYQQARSAYDNQQYGKAQLLGDAASMIVGALENIAHASLRIPDPPVIK